MRRLMFLIKGIAGVALAFGLLFTSCKNNDPKGVGVIELQNNALNNSITSVAIKDIGKGGKTISDNSVIIAGAKKTYSDIPGGKTYEVTVTNNYNNSFKCTVFKMTENKTVVLSFETTTLIVK